MCPAENSYLCLVDRNKSSQQARKALLQMQLRYIHFKRQMVLAVGPYKCFLKKYLLPQAPYQGIKSAWNGFVPKHILNVAPQHVLTVDDDLL